MPCFLVQLPSPEEMAFLLRDQKMTAVVHFLDETFDELQYDMATTVIEAVERLAGVIKLQHYNTFTLFEARKVRYRCPLHFWCNTVNAGRIHILQRLCSSRCSASACR